MDTVAGFMLCVKQKTPEFITLGFFCGCIKIF